MEVVVCVGGEKKESGKTRERFGKTKYKFVCFFFIFGYNIKKGLKNVKFDCCAL